MIPADDPSNAALVLAVRQGKQAAFATLMTRHKTWLYRFIRRYVVDRDEAYDVLQESFISAWGALARYDVERSFEVWLRRIALNKCRDRARRSAVRRAALQIMTATGFGPAESTQPHESRPEASDALQRLEKAVADLPRQLKEPLVLTALEGLSQKEAGELLGINAKAVETRVYRAKKRLAAVLDRSDLDDLADPN